MDLSGHRTGPKLISILKTGMSQVIYCLRTITRMDLSGHRTGPKFIRFWKLVIGSGYILLEITELIYQAIYRTGPTFVIFWKLEWVRLHTARDNGMNINQVIKRGLIRQLRARIAQAIERDLISLYFENWNGSGYILPKITELNCSMRS